MSSLSSRTPYGTIENHLPLKLTLLPWVRWPPCGSDIAPPGAPGPPPPAWAAGGGGEVGAGARVSLQVGVRGAEQLLGARDADLFGPVDDLAPAVVTLAGIALGVLVAQRRAERGENRRRGEVLAGDELEAATQPVELVEDDARDLGVLALQRVEVGPPERRAVGHRDRPRQSAGRRSVHSSRGLPTLPARAAPLLSPPVRKRDRLRGGGSAVTDLSADVDHVCDGQSVNRAGTTSRSRSASSAPARSSRGSSPVTSTMDDGSAACGAGPASR